MLTHIAIDQYGTTHKLRTKHPRKELLALFGRKHCGKIYIDTTDGQSRHVGYVIAGLWLKVYRVESSHGV